MQRVFCPKASSPGCRSGVFWLPGQARSGWQGVGTSFSEDLRQLCRVPFDRPGKGSTALSKHFLGKSSADRRWGLSPCGPGFSHPPFKAQAPRPWRPLGAPVPSALCAGAMCRWCFRLMSVARLTGLEESAWGDEEDAEHNYYNSIPGKEPPLGGLVDSRLTLTQPCALGALGALSQGASPPRRDTRGLHWELGPSAPPGDGYVQADAQGPRDYEDHLYVNTQGLDALELLQPEDSPKKDLFDMRPFEDALKLHECSMAAGAAAPLPLEDQWPSPPTRRAPIAPTEEQLRQEPWYHGQMSRRAAEKLLRADGDFLVRDSVTNPGQYVLTGMHAGQPKHLLLVDPEGVVRTKDVLFESISHLIDYHLQNGQPIVAAESELHLRGVVKREP
ncbi:SHC adaptor protein 2 [Phyllostomus discolor]|uniref:SHC adaptor protein 2 n=1 Tax=Phyllostomus discolor TaxID=89673 RepID=A0A833ZQR8_9CHIR|nr:SHC adaptor protein 2 [Phyllostomus discolor]